MRMRLDRAPVWHGAAYGLTTWARDQRPQRGGVLAIPLHRSRQALAQRDAGLPAGQLAQLAGIDPLAVDLPAGNPLPSDFGLQGPAGQADDERLDIPHPRPDEGRG